MWKGYKAVKYDLYENIDICETNNVTKVWKIKDSPNKKSVSVECTNCKRRLYPLLESCTVELKHKRKKKIDNIIYGTICGFCKTKIKLEVICNAVHYPKLGEY